MNSFIFLSWYKIYQVKWPPRGFPGEKFSSPDFPIPRGRKMSGEFPPLFRIGQKTSLLGFQERVELEKWLFHYEMFTSKSREEICRCIYGKCNFKATYFFTALTIFSILCGSVLGLRVLALFSSSHFKSRFNLKVYDHFLGKR